VLFLEIFMSVRSLLIENSEILLSHGSEATPPGARHSRYPGNEASQQQGGSITLSAAVAASMIATQGHSAVMSNDVLKRHRSQNIITG